MTYAYLSEITLLVRDIGNKNNSISPVQLELSLRLPLNSLNQNPQMLNGYLQCFNSCFWMFSLAVKSPFKQNISFVGLIGKLGFGQALGTLKLTVGFMHGFAGFQQQGLGY